MRAAATILVSAVYARPVGRPVGGQFINIVDVTSQRRGHTTDNRLLREVARAVTVPGDIAAAAAGGRQASVMYNKASI